MTNAAVPPPRVISGLGLPQCPQGGAAAPQPVLALDKRTFSRALDCVHCGLCLPACPTYTQDGLEADSPRGRIYLMKGLATGRIDATDSVLKHLDLCLDCRACETACPSGVVYHELIEETRTRMAGQRGVGLVDRLIQAMFFHVFPYPGRLKLALVPARLMQKVGLWRLLTAAWVRKLLPAQLDKMQQMLPAQGPVWETNLATRYPASAPDGVKRATVGFFAGCVGSVLYQDVNRQSIALLQHAGCEVVVPKAQRCCGAIHHHGGRAHETEEFARANIDAFLGSDGKNPVDFITTDIAGCGAMLKDYPLLLRDDPAYATRANAFVAKVKDISQVLVALAPAKPTRRIDLTVTYHDACHLAHAQKVTDPPRQLLSWIPGLKVVPLPESDMCCGAAGTYNLSQPKMARDLADRKLRFIQKTGARVCVAANVGCAMQIKSEADRLGIKLEVLHPVTLLHRAYFGEEERA